MMTKIPPLLFLLFTLITPPHLGSARPDPVLDIAGNILKPGHPYHILPVLRGRGGGLTFANKKDTTCPLYVVQEPFEVLPGQPVSFSPADSRDEIHTSSDQNIKFAAEEANMCGGSPVWKLVKEGSGMWFVSTGGVEGNPESSESVINWFKIELAGDSDGFYKLAFCPSVVEAATLCKELGIVIGENDEKYLALGDDTIPFVVKFKRAEIDEAVIKSVVSN